MIQHNGANSPVTKEATGHRDQGKRGLDELQDYSNQVHHIHFALNESENVWSLLVHPCRENSNLNNGVDISNFATGIQTENLDFWFKQWTKRYLTGVAGLHVTSWRPRWWSRTIVCPPLGTKLYFYANPAKTLSIVLTTNMAAFHVSEIEGHLTDIHQGMIPPCS